MTVRSEITKYEDMLREYEMYRKFLDRLTPKVGLHLKLWKRDERRNRVNVVHVLEFSVLLWHLKGLDNI